jgi:hypothetical protein
LTQSRRSTDDRRAAICLMTVFASLVVSPVALAQADERPPPSLIGRALPPARVASDATMAVANWMPELRVRAIFEEATWPWQHGLTTTIVGELAWPLGRTPVGGAVDAARVRRQRDAARESLVEKIAAAWHERRRAEDLADDVAGELAREEADAEIDALEDAP